MFCMRQMEQISFSCPAAQLAQLPSRFLFVSSFAAPFSRHCHARVLFWEPLTVTMTRPGKEAGNKKNTRSLTTPVYFRHDLARRGWPQPRMT